MSKRNVVVREDVIRNAVLEEVVRYHEQKIVKAYEEIERGKKWSRENNDGDETVAGTLYTEELPAETAFHKKTIRAVRKMKR